MKFVFGQLVDTGKNVSADLQRLIETRLLVQANSGGGKSHTLRALLEATHGHVQHIVIDPEGEFASLREKFDYVYAAPRGGDCMAAPQTAELLARRVMELRCNIIIDIYELKAHERLLFVKRFLDALINLPKNLWAEAIVVLDEADKFAPESGKGQAESRQAVVDLASRGRKRGLCAWIATQRSAKLSKDVTAELNNRIMGRATIKEDRKRNAEELGIIGRDEVDKFAKLSPGEFYVQGPALADDLSLVKIASVQTSHPKVGKRNRAVPAPSIKVKKILAELADLPKEAEAELRTVSDLRAEVTKLRRELDQAQRQPTSTSTVKDVKEVRAAALAEGEGKGRLLARAELQRELAAARSRLDMFERRLRGFFDDGQARSVLLSTLTEARELLDKAASTPKNGQPSVKNAVPEVVFSSQVIPVEAPARGAPRLTFRVPPSEGNSALPKGELLVLKAAAQYPDGASRTQISALTGYKRATRDAYLLRLRGKDLVTDGEKVTATQAGMDALGPHFEPLPTGEALQDYWRKRLPKGERECLEPLLKAYPEAVSRETISEVTEFKRTTRDAYLLRLRGKQLVVEDGRGQVKAAEVLFS